MAVLYEVVPIEFADAGSPQAAAMRQTRADESGSWFGLAPNAARALATALAIKPPIGMIGPSPAPLTPSGLLGEW